MSICNLPLELTLLVVENLKQLGDVHALLLVNRAFASLLQPVLRSLAIKSEYVEKALYRAVASRNESILRLLMDKGPKIVVCVDYLRSYQTGDEEWYHITNHNYDPAVQYGSDLVTVILNQWPNLVTKDQKGNIVLALHWALENDDERLLRLLLQAGANLDMVDLDGYTPLHIAIRREDESAVRLLLQHGAYDPSMPLDGHSPISYVRRGNDTLAALLFEYVCLEGSQERGYAMSAAVEKFGPKSIGVLLRRGLDVNIRFCYKITPLHLAIESLNDATAKFLLENGADPNARDLSGRSPLRVLLNSSVTQPPVEIGGLLIEKGADINEKCKGDRRAPLLLHIPIRSYPIRSYQMEAHEPTTRWLLENGADPSAVDSHGWTALHVVVRLLQKDKKALFVAMLIEYGVDVNIQNPEGRTALHIAIKCQMPREGIKMLLDAGANVNLRDKRHKTPLQLAAKHSKMVVGMLLDYGADVDGVDSFGRPEISEGLRKYFTLAPYCSFVDKRFLSAHASD